MRWELNLGYTSPPLSMNGRMHWAVARREAQELRTRVGWWLKARKVPAMDSCAVWLEWTPSVKRRRDTDNVESTRKVCVDAIVAAGLVEDDTPEFVQRPENVILPPRKGHAQVLLVIDNNYEGAR